MSNASIAKEALIAGVTATVVIPLLWFLGAAVNPDRDPHAPGLDLAVLMLAGAIMVVLLRSMWRNTAPPSSEGEHAVESWTWGNVGDSYGGGHC